MSTVANACSLRYPIVSLPEAGNHGDMSEFHELSAQQKKDLAEYWWQRAEGEATSWSAFKQVRRDLESLSAPSTVLELADSAIEDEKRHSLWCRDWALRFGYVTKSGEVPPEPQPRSEEALTFRGIPEEHHALCRVLLCLMTETTGCVLLDLMRSQIKHPELREQNHVHLKDELRHSRVGWAQMSVLARRDRELVLRYAPLLVRELNHIMETGGETERDDLAPYGYFPLSAQKEAARQASQEIIIPGLSAHNLWRAA